MDRLVCRLCGKPLVGKYRYRAAWNNRPTVVRDEQPYGYSYRGTNFFCSLRCGFTYAENHLAEVEFEQTQYPPTVRRGATRRRE
jgi:hypothetical protein